MGVRWGHFGLCWGHLGSMWGRLERYLGPVWGLLIKHYKLESILRRLSDLGLHRGFLLQCWSHLRANLEAILGGLGGYFHNMKNAICGNVRSNLGLSWEDLVTWLCLGFFCNAETILGLAWGYLGMAWGLLRPILGQYFAILRLSRGDVEGTWINFGASSSNIFIEYGKHIPC